MMSKMIIMSKFSLLLFFSCCFIVHCTDQTESIDSRSEASILLSIKANLIDPLNHLKDWNFQGNTTFRQAQCNWTGIQCNSDGLVEALDLSYMNLTGTVSDGIQGLTSLRRLNLCCNGFSSPLPKSLSNITSLQAIDISQNFFINDFPYGFGSLPGLIALNVSGNNFSGYLPEDIANSTMLELLDLRGNFFEGSIPGSYKSLVRLKYLGLSGNNLTGNIPGELGELSSLETMVLGYNLFEGGIPLEFGNLTNLKYLDLAIANLGGSIPVELGKLEKLNTIYLYQNNLEGKIPPELGNMTSLQFLDLSDNMLSGEIPYQIAQAKNLQLLNLMTNQLTGWVPSSIEELTGLEVLELWNNSLTGPLPADLGKNSPLQWVDVSSNSISGPIPTSLCDKGNLSKLILFNNAFSGPIPTSLSDCASLVRVRIQNNLLNGTIPSGFGKLSRLQRLELGNNSLTGQIPYDLSASNSLSFIDLSRNQLQSSLPSPVLSMPNLQKFMASGNRLFGQIPDQFQDCPNLSALDLSSNYFTGTIPSSIASCARLVSLNLRNNRLNGSIPNTLAVMPVLSVLDLSNNSLTGKIPQNFGDSPALETFNVSYNNLEGPVPLMLKTITSDDFIGNPSLCGGGLLPPCSHGTTYTIKQHKLHIKHVVLGWIVGILTLLALVISVITARSLYQKWRNSNCFEERRFESDWPWRLMAFQRLGFDAQDILGCIKESNVIGMGSTGTVYKADIPRSNTIVAVKKLWRSSRADLEAGPNGGDLSGEVNLLAKLRHRNIVKLFGFLHNDSDSMIIYEYMQNGSLGEALHGKQRGKLLVDWVSRYNVALGVAQGLAYLHHDCTPSVIHRDIKSNNILLDANVEARIADFGLAKLVMTKNETLSVVAGSYGYIAPEYGYTLKVDEKSDIYSFGVVLMELVTGKPPLDPTFGESIDVVQYICGKMRDNAALDEVLDPSMGTAKHVREEMLLVLRIAVLCTAKSPKDRPSMRDVLTMLGEAKPRRKCTDDGGLNGKDNKPVFKASPR